MHLKAIFDEPVGEIDYGTPEPRKLVQDYDGRPFTGRIYIVTKASMRERVAPESIEYCLAHLLAFRD